MDLLLSTVIWQSRYTNTTPPWKRTWILQIFPVVHIKQFWSHLVYTRADIRGILFHLSGAPLLFHLCCVWSFSTYPSFLPATFCLGVATTKPLKLPTTQDHPDTQVFAPLSCLHDKANFSQPFLRWELAGWARRNHREVHQNVAPTAPYKRARSVSGDVLNLAAITCNSSRLFAIL